MVGRTKKKRGRGLAKYCQVCELLTTNYTTGMDTSSTCTGHRHMLISQMIILHLQQFLLSHHKLLVCCRGGTAACLLTGCTIV